MATATATTTTTDSDAEGESDEENQWGDAEAEDSGDEVPGSARAATTATMATALGGVPRGVPGGYARRRVGGVEAILVGVRFLVAAIGAAIAAAAAAVVLAVKFGGLYRYGCGDWSRSLGQAGTRARLSTSGIKAGMTYDGNIRPRRYGGRRRWCCSLLFLGCR